MADNYTVVGQRQVTEFLGGSQTRQSIAVGITTKPSNIYLEFRLARADYTAANVAKDANGYAIIVEMAAGIEGVAGMEWIEDPTPAGFLVDSFVITVVSTSGDSTAQFTEPYANFTQGDIAGKVKALRAELDAAEGS